MFSVSECENMGGSNEFFDKFSVRFHISVILCRLWEMLDHRQAFVKESRYNTCTITDCCLMNTFLVAFVCCIFVFSFKSFHFVLYVIRLVIILFISYRNTHDNSPFLCFVNLLINDTTFLLDESLDSLKSIHETQEAMNDVELWNSQSQVSCHLCVPYSGYNS